MATDCEITISQRVGFRPRAAGVLAALKELAGYQATALEDVSQFHNELVEGCRGRATLWIHRN